MIEIIRSPNIIHKNTLIAATPVSAVLSVSFVKTIGGINAKIRNAKKSDTTINGIQAIPQIIGPNGVIQSWPAQVAKKIIRKKIHRSPIRLFDAVEKMSNRRNVIISAAGIIKKSMIISFSDCLYT
jgi:hypothetical protein